jgi:hypothetical protein
LGGTSVSSSWLHDSCLKISVLSCTELFTCVIVVHELCVNGNDLYATIMNDLVVSHVDYYHSVGASILWLKTIDKFVLIHRCNLQEIV